MGYLFGGVVIILVLIDMIVHFARGKYDGQIVVTKEEDGKTLFTLEINKDPDYLAKMNVISFKVVHGDSQDKHVI